MTVIYVPVKIESTEQAEALPIGTVATFAAPGLVTAAVKNAGPLPGWWCGDARVPVGVQPGWTALVPIEAEEELVERSRLCQKDPDVLHRYVTGWQPYTSKEEDR